MFSTESKLKSALKNAESLLGGFNKLLTKLTNLLAKFADIREKSVAEVNKLKEKIEVEETSQVTLDLQTTRVETIMKNIQELMAMGEEDKKDTPVVTKKEKPAPAVKPVVVDKPADSK